MAIQPDSKSSGHHIAATTKGFSFRGESRYRLMIHNQISHSARRTPHCCDNHTDEQPTRSAYHRDSAASDKDQSRTSRVHNRRLCCHNHRSLALSNNDRPVSGQQPLGNNPKITSAKPSARTGTVQHSSNSESRKGCPVSNKQQSATFPKKQSQQSSEANERL